MDYLVLKAIHQSAVVLSIGGFAARGAGALAGAAWTRGRAARSLPHLVDTVLLLSALSMLWLLGLSPLAAPWLLAKIVGLLAYIVLGAIALRPGTPRPWRIGSFLGALIVVAWIASVALTKQPAGFLRLV